MYVKIPENLKLVVFDIDNTLHNIMHGWRCGNAVLPIQVSDILQFFRDNNVIMCIASLNQHAPLFLGYYKVLHLFDKIEYRRHITKCFTDEQIDEHYSLKKINMFNRISKEFNIDYNSMLFFDDNILNICDAKELGIKSICVNPKTLLTWRNIYDGFSLFDKRKRRYSH